MVEKKEIAASTLLSEHVTPEDHVLVIGPNMSPICDPSAMFLSMHMYGGKGTLTLLDNKSPTLQKQLRAQIDRFTKMGRKPPHNLSSMDGFLRESMHREQFDHENFAALGDPYEYSKMIHSWTRGGFQLKHPRILISDARLIKKPDNSIDVVFEHGSMPWIHDVEGPLREYLRVVKPGGKVIIFTNDKAGRREHEALKRVLAPFLDKSGVKPQNGAYGQIARVTEHEFLPAYSALKTLQNSQASGKIDFEKLSPEAIQMFVRVGESKFWMVSMGGVFNCSRGFVIEKKKK